MYINFKKSVEILQKIFIFKKAKYFFKNLEYILYSFKLLDNILKSQIFCKKGDIYHKELGDSFLILGNKNNKKNMDLKLNAIMKENIELKNKILDNNDIKYKLRILSEENKKIQSINNIILKDNQQLAKKLKDLQEYRKNKLVIQKDIEKMQIHESNEELYNKNKYSKLILRKLVEKKINKHMNILKLNFDKYKDSITKIKSKEIQNQQIRNIYLKNVINIVEKQRKSIMEQVFYNLYYKSVLNQKNNNILKDKLKIIFLIEEQKRKNILYKSFYNILKSNNNNNINKITTKEDIAKIKQEKLRNIFKKYLFNVRVIYKVILEKWNLKSKLISIKSSIKEKKRKRKEKKKINKLLFNKHYLIVDNFKHRDYSNNVYSNLSKTIQELNYIIPDEYVIKDSNMEEGKLIIRNLSNNNIKSIDKIQKFKSYNIRIKNKKDIIEKEKNKIENISDEDSGDSIGLGNNSDNN